MAGIDWQTSLSTTVGLISASVVYLVTALYWVASWIALNVLVGAPRYVYRAASFLATPLTYPLYFVWRVLVFLFSPIWAFGRTIVAAGGWVVGLAVKFKYVYMFFAIASLIGILSACTLFGTSNILFSLFGITSSSQPPRKSRMRIEAGSERDYDGHAAAREEEDEDQADSSSSGTETTLLSETGSLQSQRGQPIATDRLFEQAYRRSHSTRLSPIKPSRRFRGLLAQTIHEESSESE